MISVVVPAYNAAATLPACLEALQQQTLPPDEIIVVDDGSIDGTGEIARAYGARVLQQDNRGPAVARNLGVQQARGEIVLFTDADCAPEEHWVAHLVKALRQDEIVGAKGTYRTHQRSLVARFVQQEY